MNYLEPRPNKRYSYLEMYLFSHFPCSLYEYKSSMINIEYIKPHSNINYHLLLATV